MWWLLGVLAAEGCRAATWWAAVGNQEKAAELVAQAGDLLKERGWHLPPVPQVLRDVIREK
jgi:hypothetical protein